MKYQEDVTNTDQGGTSEEQDREADGQTGVYRSSRLAATG